MGVRESNFSMIELRLRSATTYLLESSECWMTVPAYSGGFTANSLAPTAVREELARVHERRFPMVPSSRAMSVTDSPQSIEIRIYIPPSRLDMRVITSSSARSTK